MIDTFENPFLGLEGKIMKELQEEESKMGGEQQNALQVNANDRDFEQQIFESFVKEKATLLGYVGDLLRFAAKSQDIDLVQAKILENNNAGAEEMRIKNNQECGILAARINAVLEKY